MFTQESVALQLNTRGGYIIHKYIGLFTFTAKATETNNPVADLWKVWEMKQLPYLFWEETEKEELVAVWFLLSLSECSKCFL